MRKLNRYYTFTLHSKDAKNSNGGEGITVRAALPEDISLDTAAAYEAPFAQGFSVNASIRNGARLMGLALTNQTMTAQVWQGNSDIQFTIPLVLQTETDELKDVRRPLLDLMKLTLPSADVPGGLFHSPGPRVNLQKVLSNKSAGKFANRLVSNPLETIGDVTKVGAAIVGGDEGGLKDVLSSVDSKRRNNSEGAASFHKAVKSSISHQISVQLGEYLFFESVVVTDVQQRSTFQPLPSGMPQRVEVNITFRTFMQLTSQDLETVFLPGSRGSSLPGEF